ncbi:MAG: hypothetical protein Q7U16_19845 [Agitococcus sp.]|nr:hypothetical protein [Agitococcus sp.]
MDKAKHRFAHRTTRRDAWLEHYNRDVTNKAVGLRCGMVLLTFTETKVRPAAGLDINACTAK